MIIVDIITHAVVIIWGIKECIVQISKQLEQWDGKSDKESMKAVCIIILVIVAMVAILGSGSWCIVDDLFKLGYL